MSKSKIEPRVLKGFRDYLPELAIPRVEMIRTLQGVFESFGFAPIDTPALEYTEILLGKGSDETDKQLFRFTDQGGRDVAMRFDLTVPLARFAAMHFGSLGSPFRRYHIAPVWRAEKPQRGRYREFFQCDFDILGSRSVLADAEIALVMHRSLNALGIAHAIRMNNRQVLNGVLAGIGKADAGTSVLRAIDKLDKLGEETVRKELADEAGLGAPEIERVFSFLSLSRSKASNADLLRYLREMFSGQELALRGVEELETVVTAVADAGVPEGTLQIDLAIARGLDYYTGSVFETTMLELPTIGSICSGGRYNDLAALYTKQEIPGVGASVGLDRILGAYEELDRLAKKTSPAEVFVTLLDDGTAGAAFEVANRLRDSGVSVETSLEIGKLGNQIKYASRRGIPWVLIAGRDELSKGLCSLKHLESGEQTNDLSIERVGETILTRRGR